MIPIIPIFLFTLFLFILFLSYIYYYQRRNDLKYDCYQCEPSNSILSMNNIIKGLLYTLSLFGLLSIFVFIVLYYYLQNSTTKLCDLIECGDDYCDWK